MSPPLNVPFLWCPWQFFLVFHGCFLVLSLHCFIFSTFNFDALPSAIFFSLVSHSPWTISLIYQGDASPHLFSELKTHKTNCPWTISPWISHAHHFQNGSLHFSCTPIGFSSSISKFPTLWLASLATQLPQPEHRQPLQTLPSPLPSQSVRYHILSIPPLNSFEDLCGCLPKHLQSPLISTDTHTIFHNQNWCTQAPAAVVQELGTVSFSQEGELLEQLQSLCSHPQTMVWRAVWGEESRGRQTS